MAPMVTFSCISMLFAFLQSGTNFGTSSLLPIQCSPSQAGSALMGKTLLQEEQSLSLKNLTSIKKVVASYSCTLCV